MPDDLVKGFNAEVQHCIYLWRQHQASVGHVEAFIADIGRLRERYSGKSISASEEEQIEQIALAAVSRAQNDGFVEFAA
jgi:hypothetical protein